MGPAVGATAECAPGKGHPPSSGPVLFGADFWHFLDSDTVRHSCPYALIRTSPVPIPVPIFAQEKAPLRRGSLNNNRKNELPPITASLSKTNLYRA